MIGTALLHLTAMPAFALAPAFGDAGEVRAAVLRLLLVIVAAGGLAFGLRGLGIVRRTAREIMAIDASSALLLGAVVIGLMSPAAEALRSAPALFAGAVAFACMLSFGLQAVAALIQHDREAPPPRSPSRRDAGTWRCFSASCSPP